MHIDIWSDVICPWCYLGTRRLDRALERVPFADEVRVRFRAYQLDPGAPPEPGDLRASLEAKYGPGAFDSMTSRLTDLGVHDGIDYRFDLALRTNTRDAHRLLAWAYASGGESAQRPLAERLFRAYFTEGANVADHPTLVRLAAEVDLDAALAGEALAADSFATEVAEDVRAGAERGITGVPAFVIEDRWLIPGAQEVDSMVATLTRAHERLTANAG